MSAKRFKAWLQRAGAEVQVSTNAYEVARWVAHGQTHIVYRRGNGNITANGFARECWVAFCDGKNPPAMGATKKPRTSLAKLRAALIERDGCLCFYCGSSMPDDDRTIEHVVSRQNGGPDHMDNLVLAHRRCNEAADNLPLVRKVALRDRMRFDRSEAA